MSRSGRYKAIVIGSGAGGAPAAARLAEAWGDGVALVEAGAHFTAADFTQVEREMLPRLYAAGGTQATEDGAIGVVQGRGVGGSTFINDALCFRPPPELAARWKPYGVDLDALAPHVDTVEAAMGVTRIQRSQINRANYLLGLGAARLGWAGERLHHNSPGCVQCGFRHIGCSYNAKLSMNLTFVPRALKAGAVLLDETPVHHLTRSDGAWTVHTAGEALTAETVVVCAGVVQTPTILLRSGIEAGQGLQFHLSTRAWGEFDAPVDGFNGIPMAYGVTEFADTFGATGPGYLIEGCSVQPLAFSAQVQLEGPAFEAALRRYRHLAGAVPLVRSKARGAVSLKGERAAIDYPLVEEDAARLSDFFRKATRLYRAAGARRVLLAHRSVSWVTDDPGELPIAPGLLYLYAAHLFGGACRGSTTDAVGRVVDQPGLWVLDASAFPEAIGVNPQITIAALALQGAERILTG